MVFNEILEYRILLLHDSLEIKNIIQILQIFTNLSSEYFFYAKFIRVLLVDNIYYLITTDSTIYLLKGRYFKFQIKTFTLC